MRILFDSTGFYQKYGGVGKYFSELMKNLPEGYKWRLSFSHTMNEALMAPPFSLPLMKRSSKTLAHIFGNGFCSRMMENTIRYLAWKFPCAVPVGEAKDAVCFGFALKQGDFDVLHITNPHPRWNTWKQAVGKKPIVVTVHDLIPELFRRYDFATRQARRQILQDATHIIAVSENTKNDIISIYNIPPDKITVIYHGYDLDFYDAVDIHGQLPDKYLLFVGRRGGYKNFAFFVESIAPLLQKDKSLYLVCTGEPFNCEERSLLAQLGVDKQVRQRYVMDREMRALYGNAIAFIYPSLYEGFGLPILNAFAARCPVVLSKCSCFPEVAGDSALYFNPGDADTLRGHIVALLSDNNAYRGQLVAKGLERVGLFSWKKCAEETAKVYDAALASSN